MANRLERSPLSLAERKQLLIAEGQLYRCGMAEAREEIEAGLQMQSLAPNILHKLASAAVSFVAGKTDAANDGRLSALLPLVVSGVGALARHGVLKTSMRKAAIAGVLGVLVAVLVKRKWTQRRRDE